MRNGENLPSLANCRPGLTSCSGCWRVTIELLHRDRFRLREAFVETPQWKGKRHYVCLPQSPLKYRLELERLDSEILPEVYCLSIWKPLLLWSCKNDSCMLALVQLAFRVCCSVLCDGSLFYSLPRFSYAIWIFLWGWFQFWAMFSSQHSAGNYHCNANTWQSELKCTSSVVKTHFQNIDDPCNQGIFLSMGPYYIALYDAVGELG